MTIQPDERIVIETPVRRRWRLTSLGIILIVLSAVLVSSRPHGDLGLVVGLIGLVFFVPITLVLLVRAMRNNPALILDADGFTDHASLISVGFVPWQEVQRIEDRLFRRRVFVTITVTDRAALRARLPAWHRLVLRLNGPMVAGDILIPDSVLPMGPGALVKTMRRLHRAAQRPAPRGGTNPRA